MNSEHISTGGGVPNAAVGNMGPRAATGGPPARVRRSSLTFDIEPEQAAELAEYVPISEMKRVRVLLSILQEIHLSPKVQPACKRLARRDKRGYSAHHLRQTYYTFCGGTTKYSAGDWRLLLNKNVARIDRAEVCRSAKGRIAFIEFWRGLGESFHQDWAAAYDELLLIWRTGRNQFGKRFKLIPGYELWPEQHEWLGHPAGWSYANLMRHQSDPYDQTAARVGHAKASAHRLPVLTTRVGLQFGAFFEFDDHEFNQRTMFQRRPMRPLGFGAIEVLSACICHIGLKPTMWDCEAEVKRKLTEQEFMWFVIGLLMTIGYRHDIGTWLIVERGTAAIRAWLQERLDRVSAGKIHCHVGGRFGKPAHAGQFDGRSKGNYRTKRLIEGAWSLVDNQMSALPAQTGRGRDDAPEGFAPEAGAQRYTETLFRAADRSKLSPEQLSQLEFPYAEYHQWREWCLDAIARINRDREHNLEGWEKLGYVQPVWRLPDVASSQWLPQSAFAAIPEPQRSAIRAMLDADPSLLKTRRLSRQEAFDAGRRLLKPLPWELLPQLVGPENALNAGQRPLEVQRGLLRFESCDIDPDALEFYARDCRVGVGAGQFLPNGGKYICYVNPYCPTRLVACDASGKVQAVCPRYVRALRTDEHAISRLMGDQQAFEGAARTRLDLRHADAAAAKAGMEARNRRRLGLPEQSGADPRLAVAEPGPDHGPAPDAISDMLATPSPAPSAQQDDFDAEALL